MSELEHKLPEYVLQPNAISRAIYDLSTNARRLIGMAMALIPQNAKNPNDYRVRFGVSDFEKALGVTKGSENRRYIVAAVRECLDSHIEIWHPNGDFEAFTWFSYSRLLVPVGDADLTDSIDFAGNPELTSDLGGWETIEMKFNPDLGEALKLFKRAYSEIRLENLGRLQSKYAIRYYEIAQSFAGFAGKNGNPKDTWYFEYSIMEIRTIFCLAKSKYRVTAEFRRNVVEKPLEDLNAADIGLHITVEYVRRGRKLVGFRFVCRRVSAADPRPADTTERLRDKHPDRFNELLAEVQREQEQQGVLFPVSPARRQSMAEVAAEDQLAKELEAGQPKKRGRPRKSAAGDGAGKAAEGFGVKKPAK